MKKIINGCLSLSLAACMALSLFPATSYAASNDNFKNATAISFDNLPLPTIDYTRANKLPVTGYFEKSFSLNNQTRTAKVYISSEAPIRSYFTVIAVPDGVDTEEFLDKSGWKTIADEKEECLFILEPGKKGWSSFNEESEYVNVAINYFNNNSYFTNFGEHYFVGYGNGAPALEAWAAANPLKVIGQVYVDSKGLTSDYLSQFSKMEFDGSNGSYGVIKFPEGFKKITYDEVILPTWYINPNEDTISDSLSYWKKANNCVTTSIIDKELGEVYQQKDNSSRWMTSYSGSISKVAVSDKKVSVWNDNNFTREIDKFLSFYTRYENAVAYNNQLVERADYDKLGIEVKNMTVSGVNCEYLLYIPDSAKKVWGDKIPAVIVFPGGGQTDKVFMDATQWWKVAKDKGFALAVVCEPSTTSPIRVSYKNTDIFFKQLKEELLNGDYSIDASRIYGTGQSAGSLATQNFGIALPESFAAIATTSGCTMAEILETISIDGTIYPVSNKMIPNYMIYGAGDVTNMAGDLWDEKTIALDYWADYYLKTNGLVLGNGIDNLTIQKDASGMMDRFKTWTWNNNIGGSDITLFKLSKNEFRSHNCAYEEMPMLWDFLEHYSYEVDSNNNVTRYYSESAFKNAGDKVQIYSDN